MENVFYEADMVCIKTNFITQPVWLEENDNITKFETYILSYESHNPYNKTIYIMLKDVYTSNDDNSLKYGHYGLITYRYPYSHNSFEFIDRIEFIGSVCYLSNIDDDDDI